ncbi:putative 5'-nucleotidase [Geobacter sp. OR-1]|uniref:bifunctional metallophosphatase/5'-nucleotidase n=1 Tax=Geobacter sp. OR-1 TaxID=1266765 RepID=UPI000541CE5A|nr:bifunctional metallophosphatase/5'-nucleotidase [Geobacter sp. OR-1]GAM09077.1 putative 5'-nucleotidase [Geobacter sp. OR-1]
MEPGINNHLKRILTQLLLVALTALQLSCSSQPGSFKLTLAHLNDTHSHLEPVAVTLKINDIPTTAQLGGFARLKTALDRMRDEDPNLLLLHGGDAVQGTLYFTLFNGSVEFDFLNRLGVDAMTFGNHEFDRGAAVIPDWIKRSRFPWLSANIDFSAEPAVFPLVMPYLIKEINGEPVGIIGVTTETTPQTTMDVGKTIFRDPAESTRQQVALLEAKGINKIVLLSHLGYQQDSLLAARVSGVDIIVGGHSHTLLSDDAELPAIGLTSEGPYPTELRAPDGKRVLVLQAWQWGDLLGKLNVTFTPDGEVSSYAGGAVIPVGETFTRNGSAVLPGTEPYREIAASLNRTGTARIVVEDAAVAAALAPYTAQLEQFRKEIVANAANDITIGVNSGPGPLVADSMLAAVPKAQVAILNYGGVRKGLGAGKISVGDVLEVMPFANTLVLVDLTGAELKQALEEDIDFLIGKFGKDSQALPYIGGAVVTVQPAAANGSRVTALLIKDVNGVYRPVESGTIYRIVVNAFVAKGGDGFTIIRNAGGFRSDTGIIDSDAFRDFLKKIGTVVNPAEQRLVILPAGEKVSASGQRF